MRRDGEFKHHNLNRDLLDPLTTKIENPWAETFSDSPLFTDLTPAVMRHLSTLVTQIAHSAPPGLKDTIMAQGEWVEQSITLAMRARGGSPLSPRLYAFGGGLWSGLINILSTC